MGLISRTSFCRLDGSACINIWICYAYLGNKNKALYLCFCSCFVSCGLIVLISNVFFEKLNGHTIVKHLQKRRYVSVKNALAIQYLSFLNTHLSVRIPSLGLTLMGYLSRAALGHFSEPNLFLMLQYHCCCQHMAILYWIL